MIPVPIIRFEVEHLKHSIMSAFSEYSIAFDKNVVAAVESFCKPSNIQRILDSQVAKILQSTIETEVADYFKYGKGRDTIREAVLKTLNKKY